MRPLLLLAIPFAVVACRSGDDAASSDSNLDTSGCTGLDLTTTKGPVQVSASRPPTSSCWNIRESGLTLTYGWTQTNDSKPEKNDVGFWTALNGGSTFQKADFYQCEPLPSGGFSPDTSGTQTFGCTAQKQLDFGQAPDLLAAAYGADGTRLQWQVQVAVALDDNNDWDSLNGANYRFTF